jgi:hypothetical protein
MTLGNSERWQCGFGNQEEGKVLGHTVESILDQFQNKLWTELCPQERDVDISTPVSQTVTLFGKRVLTEAMKVK